MKILADENSSTQVDELLQLLQLRFQKNMMRHQGFEWQVIQAKLESNGPKIQSLIQMERTGGEPDLIGYDAATGEYLFCDCSVETPSGRRNVCYDLQGQMSRKENRPWNNALDMAASMGIEILDEQQYRNLQKLGKFDTKTSSWLKTPDDIRILGGAIFADFRYGQVFVYHNGAQSYYSSRAFRGILRV